jgi:hypothetical protein
LASGESPVSSRKYQALPPPFAFGATITQFVSASSVPVRSTATQSPGATETSALVDEPDASYASPVALNASPE